MIFRRLRRQLEAATNALDEERFRFIMERIEFRDEQYKELKELHQREMAVVEARVTLLQESHDATAQWVRQISGALGAGVPTTGETTIEMSDTPNVDEMNDMSLESIFAIGGDPLGPATAEGEDG